MSNKKVVLGLDPGPDKTGWALYNEELETVIKTGHDDWDTIRSILTSHTCFLKAVCVEQIIIHYGIPANQNLPATAENVGRIQQLCADNNIDFHQFPRIKIMEKVYMRPKRGMKISKKKMQEVVQDKLGLDKPVRPQHANDALCAILAHFPPTKDNPPNGKNKKE